MNISVEARALYDDIRNKQLNNLPEPVIFGEAVRCIIEGREPDGIVDIFLPNYQHVGLYEYGGRQWRFADQHYFRTHPDYTANLLIMTLDGNLSARLGCNSADCVQDITRRILRPRGGHIAHDVLERLVDYN